MSKEDAQDSVAATFRSPAASRASTSDPGALRRKDFVEGRPVAGQAPVATAWRRKNNRLDQSAYVGPNAYLVTIATEGRAKTFTDPAVVAMCVEKLTAAAETEAMDVFAYVFMPDHCHILLAGTGHAYLSSFVKRFKQATAFRYRQTNGGALWQKSYHDHILRHEEVLEDVASYIANNPVRAGLVSDWEDYSFTGGSAYDGRRAGDLKVAATTTPLDQGG